MKQLTCEMCGSTDLAKENGFVVCQSCGMKYSVEEAKKLMIEGTVEVQGTVKVDKTSEVETLLKRAFMFLEDKEWEKANEYGEKVLEIAPENAQAYLVKFMIDLRVNKKEDIVNSYTAREYGCRISDLTKNNNYKKALLFADSQLKADLERITEEFQNNRDLFIQQTKPFRCNCTGIGWEIVNMVDKSIEAIDIPNGILRIQTEAFRDCDNLLRVTISNSVYSIGTMAFICCRNLVSVKLPDKFSDLPADIFGGCHSLTDIDISNVDNIHPGAFSACFSLTNIVFSDKLRCIDQSAFQSCRSLKSIAIPDSVSKIGVAAFCDCSELTSVTIGKGVKKIPEEVFKNCSKLTTITFNGTIEEWNKVTLIKTWNRKVPAKHIICSDGVIKIRKAQIGR